MSFNAIAEASVTIMFNSLLILSIMCFEGGGRPGLVYKVLDSKPKGCESCESQPHVVVFRNLGNSVYSALPVPFGNAVGPVFRVSMPGDKFVSYH